MAARPPSDDLEEPDSVEFGIVALDAHLDSADLEFPATAEDVVTSLGDPSVDYEPAGSSVQLSTVLARVDPERFETRQDLLDAAHPEFERLRESSGAIAWLRSLLP